MLVVRSTGLGRSRPPGSGIAGVLPAHYHDEQPEEVAGNCSVGRRLHAGLLGRQQVKPLEVVREHAPAIFTARRSSHVHTSQWSRDVVMAYLEEAMLAA